eukprot:8305054-Alexandrium_andersonii.AAC.1
MAGHGLQGLRCDDEGDGRGEPALLGGGHEGRRGHRWRHRQDGQVPEDAGARLAAEGDQLAQCTGATIREVP